MMSVWVDQKTQSNGKIFPLIVKYQPLRCKINYTSNLPSNHLHPLSSSTQTKREREKRGEHLQWSMERAGAIGKWIGPSCQPSEQPTPEPIEPP